MALVAASAGLAVALASSGGESDSGRTDAAADRGTAAPPPRHPVLDGPHFDGAISEISDTKVVLHLLPERRRRPEITFVVPQPPPPGVDLEHLRGDAASGVNTRVFYRRDGGRYVLRGYTHPPAASW